MTRYKRENSGAYPHYQHVFGRLGIGLTGLQRGPALTYNRRHWSLAPPQ